MISLALDSNNDIFIEKGKIKRVTGSAQAVQNVRTRLLTYYGECFINTGRGVKWFEKVFIKPVNLSTVESEIKTTILATSGIATLDAFDMTFDKTNRSLSVTFGATTTDGDSIDSTVNIP